MRIFCLILALLINFTLGDDSNCLNCPFNPDEELDVPQIISRHGYPSESHIVQTEDGYLLRLHRIPGDQNGRKGNQPVFLQHGLLGSSADWLMMGDNALAFYLADNGYDVWLGNARGNLYSKGHTSLPLNSAEFWNFTWNEMGIYDLPAALYFISNTTNKPGEILYVGHSMGTTMFFVMSSMLPQVAKNVKLMVALAPVAYMTHIRSPIRYLAPFSYDIQWLAKYLGINQFLPNNKVMKLLSYECEESKYGKKVCENLIFLLCGSDKQELNEKILANVLAHDPAGTSTRTVLHYSQEIYCDGNFQQWDYGPDGNLIKYGQKTPPPYNLTNIKRPLYLMYAENDYLASSIDVKRLASQLPNLAGVFPISDPLFDHVDFIFGKHADDLVYKPLLKVFQNYTAHYEM